MGRYMSPFELRYEELEAGMRSRREHPKVCKAFPRLGEVARASRESFDVFSLIFGRRSNMINPLASRVAKA